MHRCLRVAELAHRIAEACATNYQEGETIYNLRAVYALAKTCRALHEPALDVLWYHIGLEELLLLIPVLKVWQRDIQTFIVRI